MIPQNVSRETFVAEKAAPAISAVDAAARARQRSAKSAIRRKECFA
jgi:hypothetical protein